MTIDEYDIRFELKPVIDADSMLSIYPILVHGVRIGEVFFKLDQAYIRLYGLTKINSEFPTEESIRLWWRSSGKPEGIYAFV